MPADTESAEPTRTTRGLATIIGAVCVVSALVLIAVYTHSPGLRMGAIVSVALVVVYITRSWSETVNRSTRHRVALSVIALLALLLAVYLPHLHFAGLIQALYGDSAGDRDKADALTWTRWALVVIAVALVVLTRRVYIIEITVIAVAALVFVAGAAATGDILSGLREAEKQEKVTTPPAFERGFVIPVEKLQPVARDLSQDRCVTIVTVESIPGAGKEAPPTYRAEQYSGRLVSTLAAGKPTADVSVELGKAYKAEEFARDLVAAQSIFFVSTSGAQNEPTQQAPADCPAP
jgi:hypothetical protein